MSKWQHRTALGHVQTLLEQGTFSGLTDRQLLELYRERVGTEREPAFAALVERHGPMVLRTCRAVLRDEHAAEDSFQATFLLLTRRAALLWVRESLGPWLHQVAYRVSLSARSAEGRRRRHEHSKAMLIPPSVHNPEPDDSAPAIHEELERLPIPYRAPIVLCCMEGQTQEQAAKHLGLPLGTLQSRLARGRRRLQSLLIRRGLAPSAGALAALLSGETSQASIPQALGNCTIQAAIRCASGKSATCRTGSLAVTTLIEEMLKTMLLHRIKAVSGAVVLAALTAAGAGIWAQQALPIGPRRLVAAEIAAPRALESRAPLSAGETPLLEQGDVTGENGLFQGPAPAHGTALVRYGDGHADGKKSLGGSGEMIEFSMPAGSSKVVGIRIHGSRYGYPEPPEESYLIYFLNHDRTRILHTELAPYSLFKRGPEQWVDVAFERPITDFDHSSTFWVALDFRATATKGVYVSFDKSTGGKHSRAGLPGIAAPPVNFGGDWMIEARVAP
jgi:RNA polymerase sigma factor (sigma-70 family)